MVRALKTFYKKQRPKFKGIIRILTTFDNDSFRQDLKKELINFGITNAPLSKVNDTVLSILKKKCMRSNNCHFMAKELRKAIMNRSKLRNKFLKKIETMNRKSA